MDLILESLKNVYADLDEEQDVLSRIEEILTRPDALYELDEPLEQPPQETEPEVAPEQPAEVPAPTPEPALPAIQSHMKTPAKRPETPVVKAKPVPQPASVAQATPTATPSTAPVSTPSASPATPGEPESGSVDAQAGVPDDAPVPSPDPAQNKIVNRLQKLGKAGKNYSSPLNSQALSHMDYNPRSKTLEVTFTKNGRTYEYKNVALDKVAALISSNHKGQLFNRDIKQTSPYQEV